MSAAPHISDDRIAVIIGELSEGLTMKQACQVHEVSYSNIMTRIGKSAELKEVHALAREDYARYQVQRMHDIARDETIDVQRARLMVDCIKWESARVLPKEYGDKLQTEVSGPGGGPQEHVVNLRPKMSTEEWALSHGLGTTTRPTE